MGVNPFPRITKADFSMDDTSGFNVASRRSPRAQRDTRQIATDDS